MTKAKLMLTIRRRKTAAALLRLDGKIAGAIRYEEELDRLVKQAEKHGWGDEAFLAEEAGLQDAHHIRNHVSSVVPIQGKKVRHHLPSHHNRNNRPRPVSHIQGSVDEHTLNELDLYVENTGELYEEKKNVLRRVRLLHATGQYTHAAAAELWMPWVEKGARYYAKEIDRHMVFNRATRKRLAQELATRYASGREP